jgi:hypothetical protein
LPHTHRRSRFARVADDGTDEPANRTRRGHRGRTGSRQSRVPFTAALRLRFPCRPRRQTPAQLRARFASRHSHAIRHLARKE